MEPLQDKETKTRLTYYIQPSHRYLINYSYSKRQPARQKTF